MANVLSNSFTADQKMERLQEQLVHAQKLGSIGQLAGGIAHDFNNVLAVIVGYSSILQMKMRRDDPCRSDIDEVLAAAERAAKLTRNLLAISRKQVLNPANLDMNTVVKKTGRFMSRIVEENVLLSMSFCPDPLTIYVDAAHIEQIIMNLVTNARDAMTQGGSVNISTDRADSADIPNAGLDSSSGPFAVLSVSDTGCGMDEQTQAKVFEPFFTTKEVGKGTGLGLSIVYGAVKQNNGHIHVCSEVGKGTTFRIYFPLVASRPEARHFTECPAAMRGGSECILLVEDDKSVRELARRVLTDYDYNVLVAEDGGTALKKFHDQWETVNLIITDLIMPKKGGVDLYQEARKKKPGIKVIFTSGYPSHVIGKEGPVDEERNFIAKPFSPQVLLSKVREVLDQPVLEPGVFSGNP